MPIDLGALAGGFAEGTFERLIDFGLGAAIAEALRPEAHELGQEAWKINPVREVDAGTAASIVAEDVAAREWGANEAALQGVDGERFDKLVQDVMRAPGVGELLAVYRRNLIDDAAFEHGLRKAKIEPRWDAHLRALAQLPLEPAELAKAIHRGIVRGDGLLVAEPPTAAGRVPIVPPSSIDPIDEAAWSGIDKERLRVLVGNAGLPPGIVQMLQLLNRGEIDETDFLRGVGESNMRNEWGNAVLALARQLLTPHEYAELRVRGWIDDAQMHAGAALHGMTTADTDLLFKLLGRPIAVHAVTTGEARGGTYNGSTAHIPEAYLRSLEEGNIRPEWYNLAFANRYTYPSAFVLRALVQSGELSHDDGHAALLAIGWPPELARKVADAWAGGTGAKADPHVTRAETQLWTALHSSYVADETDDTLAQTTLSAIGVAVEAHAPILNLWRAERELVRRTLTPTQIKKAYGDNLIARDDAIVRLERLGMNATDAALLLEE